MQTGLIRLAAVLLVVFVGSALAWGAGAPRILDLGDGFKFELLSAGETEVRTAHPKTLYVNVGMSDARSLADKVRLIEGADRMFEAVLLNGAEKGNYTRASVNVRIPGRSQFEEFDYLRGTNGVWLRQAGVEPWKTAQESVWNAPAAEKIDVKDVGTLWVEAAVNLPAPEGFKRAVEIDFVSKTSIVNIQQKFKEIKALWSRMDRDKLRTQGYDLVLIGNFSTPQLGRFHARKGFFVRIPRAENGQWAELPERAPDERETLVSTNDVPVDDITKSIQQAFASGLDTMRLTDIIVPLKPSTTSQVGFAEGAPVIRIDLNAFGVRVR